VRAIAPEPVANNSLGRAAISFGMLLMFVRFAQFHEMLTYVTGVNNYLLYLVGPPALICILLSGGMQRLLKNRCARYCLAFGCIMFVATPFSIWKGESSDLLYTFLKTNLIMLPVIGGLAVTWRDIRRILSMAALGGALSAVNGKLFPQDFAGRPGLAFGTVANPDDYASHLILLTPLLLWVALDSQRSPLLRLGASGVIVIAMNLIVGTASRGALLALGAGLAFFLLYASARQRVTIFIAVPVIALILVTSVSRYTLDRIFTFSTTGGAGINEEAAESSAMRKELLMRSIGATLTHPLLGVGPGEFGLYEGTMSQKLGQHGLWHGTHNTFTQVSSECGLPALFVFVAAIFSAFNLLRKAHRDARRQPGNEDIVRTLFCLMLSFVGFFTAITFLNFAYGFYMPTLVGLACAVTFGARREMALRSMPQAAPRGFSAAPGRRGFRPA